MAAVTSAPAKQAEAGIATQDYRLRVLVPPEAPIVVKPFLYRALQWYFYRSITKRSRIVP